MIDEMPFQAGVPSSFWLCIKECEGRLGSFDKHGAYGSWIYVTNSKVPR